MRQPKSDLETLLGPDRRSLPRPRGLPAMVMVLALGTLVGLALLWPRDLPTLDLAVFGFADSTEPATVVAVTEAPCGFATETTCQTASFELAGAETDADPRFEQEFPQEPGNPTFDEGDRVMVAVIELEDGSVAYQYADRDRRQVLAWVGVLFGVTVVALGRMRGLAALVGLTVSVFLVVSFIIPSILAGRDALLVALVGGSAIALVALYLAHGYTPLTHVAVIGAFGALALTALLSAAVVVIARFSGLATEEAFFVLAVPGLDPSGLLLAGIVLGAIGALDDVTVTQASAVWEVHRANPGLGERELFGAGLRVGKDHIASTVNTLLLAYAGAAMPLLILFSLSGQPLGVVANSEVVAVEIVRTLVGSTGLVAAVPLTTWLGARTVSRRPP